MERDPDNQVTPFARTNFRGDARGFGIKQKDRRSHMYVIGKTGTGKSTLLQTMIRQDIDAGRCVALLDPHGDLLERVFAGVPASRRDDVIYLNVPDPALSLGFNPLERVPPLKRPLAASGLLDVFKKIWADSWGPRLEHILRNAFFALLEQDSATLADVLRLLSDKGYRHEAAGKVMNAPVRDFWLREFEGYTPSLRAEAIAPIQNKVGAFLANPILNRILTAPRSSFDLRQVMDEGKILLVNLSKGRIGEDAAALLGSLLVSRIGLAALSRADVAEHHRRDFLLYLDEFQTFSTLSLANMLSELRKYRLSMVLAHQYMSQMDEEVRDAVLGNVGTIVSFRVGPEDAEILAKEFLPTFTASDLMSLPNYEIYLRLMIDGVESGAFSGETLSERQKAASF